MSDEHDDDLDPTLEQRHVVDLEGRVETDEEADGVDQEEIDDEDDDTVGE